MRVTARIAEIGCYYFLLSVLWFSTFVISFNVDVNFPMFFSGDDRSYFGYSVALHRNNKDGVIALVAAPRANSSLFGSLVREPGVLFKCQLPNRTCEEVVLERSGNTVRRKGTEYSYYDKKDGMWLGVSLDVQQEGSGNIVTCGHLWKNQLYENHYLPNGVCYVLNQELEQSSVSKLIPLVDRSKQSIIPPGIYYYALGQAGMSAAFSETGQDLLLGAPGFYDWIGTVVNYKVPTHPQNIERPIVPNPPADQSPSPESYIGYSVTTGHFFELSGTSYVAGAPRDRMNRGRVYVFEALGLTKNRIVTQHKMEGDQLGAYFGAVVLGVNLNNDAYTDLLISAPTYSLPNGGDEGRVYVYISDGVGLQMQGDTAIMGSKVAGSRFGTAIANAGDLNQDGYTDIVIGAPYENDRGAIYIYQGTQSGLKTDYSQKILAEDISLNLRGFGQGLARGLDVDSNKYPDLLVGAYSSNSAVILRTHPVIQVWPKLDFDVTQIDTNVTRCTRGDTKIPCFKVTACLRYTGKNVPVVMDLMTVLELDPGSQRTSRGYFRFENKSTSRLSQGTTLQKDVENCFQREVIVYEDITDYISPLMIRLSFSLTSNRQSALGVFCAICPVLDPSMPTSITRELSFRNGCGEDNNCVADLNVKASLSGYREEALVLGANKSLSLDIVVVNKGEPAFASALSIVLPPAVQVINQAQCHIQELANNSMDCKLGNPLHSGSMVKFTIKLDVSKVDINTDALLFELKATTTSEEKNQRDNVFILRVPVIALADITIRGTAQREQIIYGEQSFIDIVHTYVVLKYLPSPVRSAGVAIFIPIIDKRTNVQFLQLEGVEIGDGKSTVPGSCNATLAEADFAKLDDDKPAGVEDNLPEGSKDTPNTINLVGGDKEKKTVVQSSTGGSFYSEHPGFSGRQGHAVNCSNSICTILLCSVGPFLDNTKVAIIQVRATANTTALHLADLNKHTNISIVTEGKVWIRDYKYDPQPDNHRPDYDFAMTSLIKESLPAEPIPNWIIAISVAAGILLFCLILLALVKMGFFRREKLEEMKEKMNEETLLENKSANNTDGADGDASAPN